MSTWRPRSLFISHSWSYGSASAGLVALLDAAPQFQYQTYSVPTNDPVHHAPNIEALNDAIKNQMLFCDVVLIMAGKFTTYHKWILREIAIAKKDYRKPIVAIRHWSREQVSPAVLTAADRVVGWNTKSIVSAICELDP